MAAVLWVGENRRADPRARWHKTLRQVFLQPKQFSCFNAGSPVRDKLLIAYRMDPISWERADSVCDLFELGILIDPTVGATHYCLARLWGRDDAQRPGGPSWHSQQEIAAGRTVKHVVIGGHVFGRAA